MHTLEALITILVPLLIIMDPLGNSLFFRMFTEHNTSAERRKTAAVASVTACIILVFFCITGDFVLRFFRIGLPAFQLAGGFIFFVYALQMLGVIPRGVKTTSEERQEGVEKDNVALVPLATPLLAGPGAITAVLVWQQTSESHVRACARITWQTRSEALRYWRSNLGRIWPIRLSKTTGIASYSADFANEASVKDGLKLRCQNGKLFLRKP